MIWIYSIIYRNSRTLPRKPLFYVLIETTNSAKTERLNFYYEYFFQGASVIRMARFILGEETFKSGLHVRFLSLIIICLRLNFHFIYGVTFV